MSLKLIHLVLAVFLTTVAVTRGQQAVSSIVQSRLFMSPPAPASTGLDANGNAVDNHSATTSDDESFGTQIILKNQERPRSLNVFGDVSGFYTNNVDLTPQGTRSDFFAVANVGAAWRPIITRGLAAEISTASSIFRYDKASKLDFERISIGGGLTWLVPHTPGILAFGRYDFTELLDSSSNELLQDHEFTIGAQKTFGFGRSHFLTTGITGVLGISTPRSQERDQAGIYAAYHLQITRSFDTDLVYRYAAQFYAEDERVDHNQTVGLSIGYYPTRWMRLSGSISGARNDSNRGAFSYEVLNLSGGIGCSIKF